MYTIGIFSKMNKITTKTLRHYDQIGLLKPELIDPLTNYRYYSSDQFLTIFRIKMLQQIGLSLQDIRNVLNHPDQINHYLQIKEKEIQGTIQKEQDRLLQLQNYLSLIKDDYHANYDYVVKSLPAVTIAYMRRQIPDHQAYFDIYPEMGSYMTAQNLRCSSPPYCFTIYYNGGYGKEDIDVEICEAVVEEGKETEHLKFKSLPSVEQALSILHRGPYDAMDLAYNAAYQWIHNHHYEPIDSPRESYIDGIWNKENTTDWLTEIQIPIKKIDALN